MTRNVNYYSDSPWSPASPLLSTKTSACEFPEDWSDSQCSPEGDESRENYFGQRQGSFGCYLLDLDTFFFFLTRKRQQAH